jgi:hypothetical protein
MTGRPTKPPEKRWTRPPPGWVKLNFDESVKTQDGTAGMEMVIRGDYGNVILEGETRACDEGLHLALQLSEKPTLMEVDCYGLMSTVTSRTQDRSSLMHLVKDINSMLNRTRRISFVKVDGSQNRVSHYLANFATVEARHC